MVSHHTAAYTSSILNGAVLLQLTAVADGIMPTRDSAIVVTEYTKLGMVMGFGTNLTRVQMQAPSFRPVAQLEVVPVENAAPGAGALPSWMDLFDAPLEINPGEELAAWVIQGNAGAQQEYVFVSLVKDKPAPRFDRFFTIRVTGTTTLTANAWTNVTLTFDQSLPKGRFAVVGARMKSVGALAFRFFAIGETYRPGGLATQGDLAAEIVRQRRGVLGTWFEFDYLRPPTVDFFSTSADTAETGQIDLVYLGPGT